MFTFELKNNLTKQTADDVVLQYQQDRNPREKLFEFGRCIAHFAVDEREVQFCTRLSGGASWFLPFNRGWNDGAGNPPNPHRLAIDYLWRMSMGTMLPEGGVGLSAGLRQRLLTARALVRKPPGRALRRGDERTGQPHQTVVQNSLKKLGVTRLVIAHRLSSIRGVDRIHLLDAGRIVESGGYDELMERDGMLAALCRRQLEQA